jgi:hypothetical protein
LSSNAAAAVVAAWVMAGGAIALGVACIPDLPISQADGGAPLAAGACGDGIVDLAAGEQCDPGPGAGDAGIGGCSGNCQMQCPSGAPPWPTNHHCYYSAASLGVLSLHVANGICPGASHVVTYASEEEFQHTLPLAGGDAFWVGISASGASSTPFSAAKFEPGWSLDCPGCYAHTLAADADLPVFPDASVDGGVVDCFAAVPDPAQPWQRYPCRGLSGQRLEVICELEPVGRQSRPCEAGICIDLVKTYGAKGYMYQANRATPDGASRACVALGGRLVVLQSRDEREQLWRELSRLTVPPSAVWIGLSETSPASFRVPTGTWAWDDHTPADGPGAYPPEWATGEPLRYGRGGTPRAFLYHDDHSPSIDDTLARNDPTLTISGTLPFVCEVRIR